MEVLTMLRRKIEKDIMHWIESSEKALLVYGVRQAGKTYIIRKCLKKAGCNYVEFNLIKQPEILTILANATGIDDLILKLSLFSDQRIVPGKTVFFFDEIQKYKEIVTKIKFLVDDKRFRYVLSGSLLGVEITNLKSAPVGYLQTLNMYPMDFEEFLWAMGNDMMAEYIDKQFEAKKPMGDFHREAMRLFRQYLIVGGMPQAVDEYVKSKDFDRVDAVKRQILRLYRNDIKKYGGGATSKISALFESIPGQLQKGEKKFRLSELDTDARMRDYNEAFFWLNDACLANICYNTTAPNVGLQLNEERTTLKCYFCDTGLLISMAFDARGIVSHEVYQKLMFEKLEINEGMLIENIVAQMLRAAGHKLFFYSSYDKNDAANRMEIDFLIQKKRVTSRHNISPVEVKSGTNYTLTSIKKCIGKFGQYLSTPYVIHTKDMNEKDGIVYIPIYMTPFL